MKNIKLSLVVPFFNEGENIVKNCRIISQYLARNFGKNYELIFVNDGSTDDSEELLKKELAHIKQGRIISYSKNRGRGYALSVGFKNAPGEVIGFIDADLDVKPEYILKCYKLMDKFDITVVSKYHPLSKVETTFFRRVTSKIFVLWVSLVLGKDLGDHQGGLKLFKREVVGKILPKVKSERWLFDLEFLYYAKKSGFSLGKIPISIKYGFGTGLRLSFALDFLNSLLLVFKLRFHN